MAETVLGTADLVRKLRVLPEKVANKGLRQAMKAAAKPVVDATKSYVPVRTGVLRLSIDYAVKKITNGMVALIGPRHVGGNVGRGVKRHARKITKKTMKGLDGRSSRCQRFHRPG